MVSKKRILTKEHREKISKALKGIKRNPFTKEHRQKLSKARENRYQNDNHPGWKGDKASYDAIHLWVRKHWGSPTTCQKCRKKNLLGRSIHWANKNHSYKRVRKDWVRLCSKCHGKFDSKNRRKLIRN